MPQEKKLAMKDSTPKPSGGYRPTTVDQRNQWNNFLKYLYTTGDYGNKELDQGDDKTALLLESYRKINPNFTITKDDVPSIQYEISMIKKGEIPNGEGGFKKNTNQGFQSLISKLYKQQVISPVDGRIGSLTSQQPYPVASTEDRMFGTDYNSFLNETSKISRSAAGKAAMLANR